ncbi:hypothetical protein LTR37_006103 [Vermiconidia calcicola]|uniref:Uncharacterized protein n=1 Tax=Vermiconidia calcicola TaxID=1690605 RepID=A0ACC3NIK0_9PEZI|nr:hypothetical protein LTR37_006103 [Vermiconidia calcicola]
MCLLKAWMFAAGLLLGFSLFAQGDSGGGTNEAFHHARAVLKKLAELSPQAAHYHDILTSFSESIEMYRRKLKDEKRRMTSRYLDQTFTSVATDQECRSVPPTPVEPASDILFERSENMNTAYSRDGLNAGGYNGVDEPFALMLSEGYPWPADDFAFEMSTSAYSDDIQP